MITDFGLAQIENEISLTRSGMITGTPHYMSPEMAQGKSADARSDLFSLGCTLYFMATGRPPFDGANAMAVMHQLCQETAPDVRLLNPAMPASMANLVHSLLEPRPEHRLASAEKAEHLLTQFLAHLQQPLVHRPPRVRSPHTLRAEALRKLWQRSVAGLASCVVVAGLVAGAVWFGAESLRKTGSLSFGAPNAAPRSEADAATAASDLDPDSRSVLPGPERTTESAASRPALAKRFVPAWELGENIDSTLQAVAHDALRMRNLDTQAALAESADGNPYSEIDREIDRLQRLLDEAGTDRDFGFRP